MRLVPREVAESPGRDVLIVFGGANLVGGVVVWLYLTATGQESFTDVQQDLYVGAHLMVGYLAFCGLAGAILGTRALQPLTWRHEGRRPRVEERIGVLRLPRTFLVLSLWAWAGGTVLFASAGAAVGDSARDLLRSSTGTMLGALTTSAMTYLLVERVLRSTFADVLRDGPLPVTALRVRSRIALAWILGSGVPLFGIATAPVEPTESVGDLAALAAIGFVAGAVLIRLATRSISERLASVREALERVEAGDLSVDVPVDEAGELGTLQARVNAMVHGLRERQVIADLFGRHVGDEVARLALEEGVHLGGEQRDVSVLFLDVTGSTMLAATRPATEVVAMLNALFSVVVKVVADEGGWVDKFEGDGVLCVWGAPAPFDDHPTAALRCARRLCGEVTTLAQSHYPDLDVGIGVSSGLVVAGNVGAEQRYEYTVIGDPVNEAARLTEAAKARDGRLLASARVVSRAAEDERCHWVPEETLLLRGRPEATPTFGPRTLVRPSGV